jgi:hypothetical protein
MANMTPEEIYETIVRHAADPGVQAVRRRLRKDFYYAQSHIDEWRSVLPEQWVAVQGQKIVANGRSSDEFIKDADSKGISLAETYVTFVAKERPLLVL